MRSTAISIPGFIYCRSWDSLAQWVRSSLFTAQYTPGGRRHLPPDGCDSAQTRNCIVPVFNRSVGWIWGKVFATADCSGMYRIGVVFHLLESVEFQFELTDPRWPQQPHSEKGQLSRVLGFRDLVLLIIGTVIGSGIFLVPGAVLRPVGNSVPLAMAVWLTGGVLSLLGAMTYGELSAMKPQAGGLYVYIRDCFGPFLAFLFGWTLFFVISAGSIATLAVAFSAYFAEFIPLAPAMAKLVSVLMIAVITVVNVRGTRGSADLQNVTTATKVFAILLMGAALVWLGKSFAAGPARPAHLSLGTYASGFGLAMISVLWAYEGWQYATFSAGETINPQRNFPLAFLVGIGGADRHLPICQFRILGRARPARRGGFQPGGRKRGFFGRSVRSQRSSSRSQF